MGTLKTIFLMLGIISCFLIHTQGADKYTDGNRPYEFGFKIGEEQHRHEKKDENGLIMGEFGFITADGVYHVTVYATDEQGRFKILSMKNIRVKPYPTYNKQPASARQGHSLDLQNPQQTLPQDASLKPKIPFKKITIEKPARSCSSCSLPTTTTPTPAPAFVQPNVQNYAKNVNTFSQNPASVNPQYTHGAKTNSFPNQQNAFNNQNVGSTPSSSTSQQNNFNNPQTYSREVPRSSQNTPAGNQNFGPQAPPELELIAPKQDSPAYSAINSPQTYPQTPVNNNPQQPVVPKYSGQNPEAPQTYPSGPGSSYPADAVGLNVGKTQGFGSDVQPVQNGNTGERTAKKYDGEPQQTFGSAGGQPNGIANNNAGIKQGQALPNKPTLISAQMQIVNKNTDIYQRGPGEKEGLPNGLTKNDMTQLLYTFNYTVGFHGHFEEGYINGAKQGYYYVTGRNGVRTRVDYVADEKGFRPKITQEVLDLLSEDVPKLETEKDDKYGLKGYEFKWLYFPVEPKGR